MIISYFIRNKVYLNITNRCTNNCIFCIKNFKKGIGGYDLRLKKEPDAEEVWNDLVKQKNNFNEIVYCGIGEPILRLDDVILALSEKFKKRFSKSIRVNTNGQAGIIYPGRDIPKELVSNGINKISISMNAENFWLYNLLCRPKYTNGVCDNSIYERLIGFIEECQKQKGLETEITVLDFPKNKICDGIPQPDIKKCKKIADGLNVKFRIRKYIGPKLK